MYFNDRLEIRLPEELKEKVIEKAESKGLTITEVIRELLLIWLDED